MLHNLSLEKLAGGKDMKLVLSTKVVLLIVFLVICYFSSSLIGGHARSVRTDPFGIHATHLGQENLVNSEKQEKLKDDEGDLVSMDYTAPRRKPPIHN
ncbi:hypothetical protein JHK82_045246 [Glycine max]|uniref:Uncharacterized protein n=1 Tax=Glycine max TaxID=3847 RepID=A0A0R0G075_SOYBN|nr:hypothetical protein JHK86_045662 [Glycine max]KAG4941563.1 hypothetical protein JHK87_045434 [Glycine soja]KAG4952374.1 hypothetical protein JHK85_046241 [Glycine max]KAG5100194.1 hypothetical protein JHK82_045246 [Glycine max]KAH1151715.1 hypothetical protein GYH30_045286 [Glycine max]